MAADIKESDLKYRFPFSVSDYLIRFADSEAHSGSSQWAVDFLLPEGTEVLAAADGRVVNFKDDSDRCGPNPSFADDANYITLDHGPEHSQYVHLKYRSVVVEVGDIVEIGQVIGYTGSTGWTTEPHLHFMVFKAFLSGQFESRRMRPLPLTWHSIQRQFRLAERHPEQVTPAWLGFMHIVTKGS